MTFNFDQWVDRSHSDSLKWNKFRDADVIPLWVADTDFVSPPSVIEALQKRVAEGVFGYGEPPEELIGLLVQRLSDKYDWAIRPEWIVWLPGLVCGLNLAVPHLLRGNKAASCRPLFIPLLCRRPSRKADVIKR